MIDTQLVMKMFRCGFKSIGGIKVGRVLDHGKEEAVSLENSSIEYRLAGGSSVVIRQSGAEPKLEVCISVASEDAKNAAAGDSVESALKIEKRIREDIESIIYMDNRMGYCCE